MRARLLVVVVALASLGSIATAGPRGRARPPAAARIAPPVLRTLTRAPARAGDNGADVVTVLGGRRGRAREVFKAASREVPARPNIPVGTYHRREVAVYRLAVSLGLRLVPHTAAVVVDGEVGSLQRFVDDTVDAGRTPTPIDRAALERLQVLDYVIGNDDRRAPDNLLFRRGKHGLVPVAIDNGLTLPLGPPGPKGVSVTPGRRSGVNGIAEGFDLPGPLLASTRRFLRAIDPRAVAEVLAAEGIEDLAIVHALRRLAKIQKDPDFLAIASGAGLAPGASWDVFFAERSRIKAGSRDETQGLAPDELAAIDALVASVARPAAPAEP